MQILGTVQGDCNPLDRLMLEGVVTPSWKCIIMYCANLSVGTINATECLSRIISSQIAERLLDTWWHCHQQYPDLYRLLQRVDLELGFDFFLIAHSSRENEVSLWDVVNVFCTFSLWLPQEVIVKELTKSSTKIGSLWNYQHFLPADVWTEKIWKGSWFRCLAKHLTDSAGDSIQSYNVPFKVTLGVLTEAFQKGG